MLRLLEGEPLIYDGVLWIVKGYQHPPGKVIAFPRYDLVNKKKIVATSRFLDHLTYWDCLKIEAPMIDCNKAYPYTATLNPSYDNVISFLREYIGFKEYVLTGSSLIGAGNDLDIVVYGFKEEYIETIKDMLIRGIVGRSEYILYKEYLNKHKHETDLRTYIHIKKNTLLHILYRDIHINFKFVKYVHGFNQCIDPVYKREFFYGKMEIIEPIEKYVVPSRYRVEFNGREYILETYREIYAELPLGRYYVEGFLEYRRNGIYIVPDHGRILWMNNE